MPNLAVECILSPPIETNSFLVADPEAKRAVAVDPACVGKELLERCEAKGWELEAIVLTHGHVDHIHDAAWMAAQSGKPLLAHALTEPAMQNPSVSGAAMLGLDQTPCSPTRRLEDNEIIEVGGAKLRVLFTPGHAPGHICLFGEGVCFTGDLLFAGGVGRWDFPDADYGDLVASMRRLARECPDDTVVYPGHGPSTTLGRERRDNAYLVDWLKE